MCDTYSYPQRRYGPVCGLYYNVPCFGGTEKVYLPQVEVKVHASILTTTSRTVLKQIFVNPSPTRGIREVRYAFPLYDGVSVVGFSCHVGNRFIVGEVKEKEKAKEVYRGAVARGETAGLLEQLPEASDVFTTTIGNIPPGARVIINITYLGELKHDMEVDGIRFIIPTSICPRYGNVSGVHFDSIQHMDGTISIAVDAEMAEGSSIQKLQSPTHPISMSMGTTSVNPDAVPSLRKASATLSLGVTHLETDFVLQVIAKDTGIPKAILETHPAIANHQALMATLVPKFALPPEKPEIVFICDQSGSMRGKRMNLAIEALQVFLKSLPVGIKFNICSFGNNHSFLWPRSVTYGQDTLDHATHHAVRLQANYGGTEMLEPLRATVETRYKDMPLDIILLTDGDIWKQQEVFDYLNEQIQENKAPIRVFTLGIGSGVSHSLIEGIAKAGNGFSQSVQEGEKMSSKVVRMLKGALSPHVNDYTLEVKYSAAEEEEDFEIVEKVADSLKVKLDLKDKNSASKNEKQQKPISLFDASADLDAAISPANESTGEDRYAHLPSIPIPKILQAPQSIPPLFAFNRTTIYLLLSPSAPHATPTSVILRGTSPHGPLELEIPIQVLSTPGETIHQLAAKKAVSELEQGRGWLASAVDADGELLRERFDGRFGDMVEREAVRLGVQFQVGGKWCSFVAVEKTSESADNGEEMEEGWEYLEDEQPAASMDGQLGEVAFSGVSADRVRVLQQQRMQQQQQFAQAQRRATQATGSFSAASPSFNSAPSIAQTPPPFRGGWGGAHGGITSKGGRGGRGGVRTGYQYPDTVMQQQHQQQQQQSLPNHSASSVFGRGRGGRTLPLGTTSQQRFVHTPNHPNPLFGASLSTAAAPIFGSLQGSSGFGSLSGAPQGLGSSTQPGTHALQNYQMQMELLEQENKKRLLLKPSSETEKPRQKQKRAAFEIPRSKDDSKKDDANDVADAIYSNSLDASHIDLDSYQPDVEVSRAESQREQEEGLNMDLGDGNGDIVLENFDVDTCLHPNKSSYQQTSKQGKEQKKKRCQSSRSAGTETLYSPTSPSYSLTSPTYSLASPNSRLNPSSLPNTNSVTSSEILSQLIAHQTFSGSFPYNVSILTLLGISVQAFEKAVKDDNLNGNGPNENLFMTALVIVYLEKKLSKLKGEWELVVEKARTWLEEERKDYHTREDMFLDAAEKLIRD